MMTELASRLGRRPRYGMSAYANGTDAAVFLQLASAFDTRYSTLAFNDSAPLDDGDMRAPHVVIPALTDVVVMRVTELGQQTTSTPS